MKNGELRELSRESIIVDSISGRMKRDHKVYFPLDFLEDDQTHAKVKKEILTLLKEKGKKINPRINLKCINFVYRFFLLPVFVSRAVNKLNSSDCLLFLFLHKNQCNWENIDFFWNFVNEKCGIV